MKTIRLTLWMLVALGAVAGLFSAGRRAATEYKNRSVEITVEFSEVQKLASAEGRGVLVVLNRLKEAGVTSVAVTEDTLSGLEEPHRIEVIASANRDATYFMALYGNFRRIVDAIHHKTNWLVRTSEDLSAPDANPKEGAVTVEEPYSSIRSLGVGLDPDVVAKIKEAHLGIVGRVNNVPNVTPTILQWVLDDLKKQGVQTVIFSGDEVLGYPKSLTATAEALDTTDLQLGVVEFGKQKGDAALQRKVPHRVIRVHTITGTEMATATVPENVQRFSLAARERNLRLLYVRLFLDEPSPIEANAQYIEKIVKTLRRSVDPQGGLSAGKGFTAHPYADLFVPLWTRGVLGLGLGAAVLLFLELFAGTLSAGTTKERSAALFIALLAALLPIFPKGEFLGVKAAAFLVACLFPSIAVIANDWLATQTAAKNVWPALLQRLIAMTGITALGIVYLVGLLADRVFLVKADAFVGIKVAQLVPLVVAALVYVGGLQAPTPAAFRRNLTTAGQRLRAFLAEPIHFWQAAAAIGVLVVLVLLVIRSGNEGSVAVSGIELKLRDLLDRILPTRPRFKEFAFGHPAMVVALWLALNQRRAWAVPVFLLGVIGQVSFLNTFCHLHTPLVVSAIRDLLGLVIGVVFGVVLVAWTGRLLPKQDR